MVDSEAEERSDIELDNVRRQLKSEERQHQAAAKHRSAALRWVGVPLFLVFGLWIPLSDAPGWGQALGLAVGALMAYVVYTIEGLKTQFNAIGEMTYQNWARHGGPYNSDED